MPSLLQQRLFREMAHLFVLSTCVLMTLILIGRAVQMREMLLGLDMNLLDTALLFCYMTPLFLMLIIPVACMLSVFLTFLRMGTDRELIALRAGGVSIYQMLPAPVLFSILCTALALWVSLHWLPWGMSHFRSTVMEIATTRARIVIQPGVFNADFPNLVLFARRVDPDAGTLFEVLVNDRTVPEREVTILAPEGTIASIPEKGELVFNLKNGKLYSSTGSQTARLAFDAYTVRLPLSALFGSVDLGEVRPREMSWNTLLSTRDALKQSEPQTIQKKGEGTQRTPLNIILTEIQRRWAYPAACIALAIFVLPMAAAFQGLHRQIGLVLALLMFFVYYSLMSLGFTLGETGVLPPSVGLWMPNALFLLAGGLGVRLTAREHFPNFINAIKLIVARFKSIARRAGKSGRTGDALQ